MGALVFSLCLRSRAYIERSDSLWKSAILVTIQLDLQRIPSKLIDEFMLVTDSF